MKYVGFFLFIKLIAWGAIWFYDFIFLTDMSQWVVGLSSLIAGVSTWVFYKNNRNQA